MKLCPFMSRPLNRNNDLQNDGLFGVECQAPNCMAWKPAVPEEKMKGDSWNALAEYIGIDRGLLYDIAEEFCKDEAKGHCKLIRRH